MTRLQNRQIYRNGETSCVCKIIHEAGCILLSTVLTIFLSYSVAPEKKGEKAAVSSMKPRIKLRRRFVCLSDSAAADRP